MASNVLDVHTQLESSYEEHVEALAIGNTFGIPLDFVGPAVGEVDFGRLTSWPGSHHIRD
jgi:hypothetical protein